jgi:hypothetical protein
MRLPLGGLRHYCDNARKYRIYSDSAEIRGNRLTTAMDAILVHR